MSERIYQDGEPRDRWELGIFEERDLICGGDEPTWANFAAAYNEYYGCSSDSSLRLHVDESGRAYTIPKGAS